MPLDPRLCIGPLPADGLSRRQFLNRFGLGLGGLALAELLNPTRALAESLPRQDVPGILSAPHFPARAKRVIYLFMSGGPSQLETFDYKPILNPRQGDNL